MEELIKSVTMIGISTILITPLTLIIGIINAIKKQGKEAIPYTVMAIVSAYLIIMPIFYMVLKG